MSRSTGGLAKSTSWVGQRVEQFSHLVEQGHIKREYRDHRLEWMIRMGGLQVVLDGIEKDNIRFSYDF